MTTEPFIPHADSIQTAWVRMCQQSRISTQPPVEELEAEFDRFLARVRRDAARQALDGLVRDMQEKGRCAAESSLPDVSDLAEIVWHAQDEARTYRDRHYPAMEGEW